MRIDPPERCTSIVGDRKHYPIWGGPHDGSNMCLSSAEKVTPGDYRRVNNNRYLMVYRPVTVTDTHRKILTAVWQGKIE